MKVLIWERENSLTHVGTGKGDYRQRKKNSRHRRIARKQGVKNLLKIKSTKPSEK